MGRTPQNTYLAADRLKELASFLKQKSIEIGNALNDVGNMEKLKAALPVIEKARRAVLASGYDAEAVAKFLRDTQELNYLDRGELKPETAEMKLFRYLRKAIIDYEAEVER